MMVVLSLCVALWWSELCSNTAEIDFSTRWPCVRDKLWLKKILSYRQPSRVIYALQRQRHAFMKFLPSPNVKLCKLHCWIFHFWSAKMSATYFSWSDAWHHCNSVCFLHIFMGLSRLQRQAEISVRACRPLVYNVQTAWNDIAGGNIMVKHNEFLLCESFILFFLFSPSTLTLYDLVIK